MPNIFQDLIPVRNRRVAEDRGVDLEADLKANGSSQAVRRPNIFSDLIPEENRGAFGLGTAETIRAPRKTDVLAKEFLSPVGQIARKAKGLASGVVGSAAAMAAVPKLAETTLGIDTPIGRATDRLSRKIESKAKVLAPADPDFSDLVASGFGSTLTFFIPGVAVVRVVGGIAKVAPVLATWLGVGTATVMEAATEAG